MARGTEGAFLAPFFVTVQNMPAKPTFFANQDKFRSWLEQNHATVTELLVGFWKVGTGKPSMTWSESVDQALCFGWIDGVRKRIDDESYSIRFTPRRPTSFWSKINIDKVASLSERGLMTPAGFAAFEKMTDERAARYAYEKPTQEFTGAYLKKFRAEKKAWEFFTKQAPSYQRIGVHWVYDAKQEITRLKRLDKLIAASAEGKRVV